MFRERGNFALGLAAGVVLAAGLMLLSRADVLSATGAAEPTAGAPAATGAPDLAADEKAIRATAEDYMRAFNAGDPQAVAALWAWDARYTDESGQVFQGREAIQKLYADLFTAHPGSTVTIKTESLRFLGPDIAVEKGVAEVKSAAEGETSSARYTVVHARREGKWVMVVARDSPFVPGPDDERLKDLSWLIGEWKIEGPQQPLRARFEWMAQKNFIKNTFTTMKDGQATLAGGQIIGWNPQLGRIVSWHFDPQGGFGNDVWSKDGAKWVIEASGVLRNGSESSAVNTLTPIDANTFTWQSGQRTLDGVSLPDIPPVQVIRAASTGQTPSQ